VEDTLFFIANIYEWIFSIQNSLTRAEPF